MKVSELVNGRKLIKRLWLILWAIMGILLVLKFCFNIWYPITINNQFLVKVFNWIDTHDIARYFIYLVFYEINIFFTIMSCVKCKRPNLIIWLFVSCGVLAHFVKSKNEIAGAILEIMILIILPIFYNIKCKSFNKLWLNICFPIFVNALLMAWQLNILFIRDINDILTNAPSLIGVAMMLDNYIFAIILWLGVSYMGLLGPWFFGKELTELKAEKEKELKKKNPDLDLIRQIDKAITELEGE